MKLRRLGIAVLMSFPLIIMGNASHAATLNTSSVTLKWGQCSSRMPASIRCGVLTVPLDWDNPSDGRTASIAVAVHRATGTKKIGALAYNPGGPGSPAVDQLPTLIQTSTFTHFALPHSVLERFDIVTWDPRGVGASTPALTNCPKEKPRLQGLPQTGPIDWLAQTQAFSDAVQTAQSACLAANIEIAKYLGTYYVIRDLEALRIKLAEPSWNYWGVSYGTSIGEAYARDFGQHLRTLVLDGVAANSLTMLERASMFVWGDTQAVRLLQRHYGAVFARKVQIVLAKLNERTYASPSIPDTSFGRWSDADVIGVDAAISGLFGSRGYGTAKQYFLAAYDAIVNGDAVPTLRQRVEDRDMDSSVYMANLVLCADSSDRVSVAQVADLAEAAEDTGVTTAGATVINRAMICPGFQSGFAKSLTESSTRISLKHPPLLINALGDLRTQWLRAEKTASVFKGSRLITYNGTQHGLYRRTSSTCINERVTQYLLTTKLPSADWTCAYVDPPAPG